MRAQVIFVEIIIIIIIIIINNINTCVSCSNEHTLQKNLVFTNSPVPFH